MPTVVQLRSQLEALGLPTTGKKSILEARLSKSNTSMVDLTNSNKKSRTRKTGPKSFHAAVAAGGDGSDVSPSPRKKRRTGRKSSNSSASSSSSSNKKTSAKKASAKKKAASKKSSSPDDDEDNDSDNDDDINVHEKSDMKTLSKLTRQAIESKYDISGKKGKEGTTFVARGKSGKEYAIKLFKATKSSAKIQREADFQALAAVHGISPRVMAVNTTQKYIVMEKLEETIVDFMKRKYPTQGEPRPLTNEQQDRIIEICEKLDEAKVVQNDGNPLNLMLDTNGTLMVIDFGFAKKIDKKVVKKRGSEPNINLTLWHFHRQLRHYKIMGPKLSERVDTYMRRFNASRKK